MKLKTLLLTLTSAVLLGACVNIPETPSLDITLPIAGTEEVWKSADYKGQPVLVAVMASYCGWCKRSLPALESANAEFKDKGVQVIGIYGDDNEEAVNKIIQDYGLQSIILYQGGKTAEELMVQGFPHIMLFDKNHRLVQLWSGYSDNLAEQYSQEINKLLN